MRGHGTTTFEAKSGYGLDRETSFAQLLAVRAAGGIPTWLGAHAVPPECGDADSYVDFLLAEVLLPEAAAIAEAADVFLERGAFDAGQARRYLVACRDARVALRLHGDQFTESGAIPLAIERFEAAGRPSSRRPGRTGCARLPRATSSACCCRRARCSSAVPSPARALVDAGAAVALATDFNPGSAFSESLPVACSLACTQMRLAPEEALSACTVNAAHVLGRADRIGRIEAGYDADLALLDTTDWRHLAYHLAGDVVHTVIERGSVALSRRA